MSELDHFHGNINNKTDVFFIPSYNGAKFVDYKQSMVKKSELPISSQDGFVHHRVVADPGQTPIRIDKFLMDRLEKSSRNRIQNGIKAGTIRVNDQLVKANHKIKPGEVVTITLPEAPEELKRPKGEDIDLEIVYEDDVIMIINKPPDFVVHPGTGNHTGTLVNALIHHFDNMEMPILEGNEIDRPGLVHRIDKDTSGLLVIAKTPESMTFLAKQFFDHDIERKYYGLVWGSFDEPEGAIDMNIGRHLKDRMKMHTFPDGELGKRAVTHYKVIEDLYYVSLVEFQLETGRTHQIRVHMSNTGHPIFNDQRYSGDRIVKGTVFTKYKQFVDNCFELMPRHALHAKSLGFVHPVSKERMYFEIDLPEDMTALLEKWRGYISSRKNLE